MSGTIDVSLDGRRRALDPAMREAIMLVLLTLQTGRPRTELTELHLLSATTLDPARLEPGIVITDKSGYLILPSHLPAAPGRDPSPHHRTISDCIILPLSRPLRRAIVGSGFASVLPGPLFTASNDRLDRCLRHLLRGEGEWRVSTVKAERGLHALQRWLRQRLSLIEGGDPALSVVLNPAVSGVSKTLASYTTIAADRHWSAYRRAVLPLDRTLPNVTPAALAGLSYGDARCPDNNVLRAALERIVWLAERRGILSSAEKQLAIAGAQARRTAPLSRPRVSRVSSILPHSTNLVNKDFQKPATVRLRLDAGGADVTSIIAILRRTPEREEF